MLLHLGELADGEAIAFEARHAGSHLGVRLLSSPPSWKMNRTGAPALVGNELVPHGMGFDCSIFRHAPVVER